MNGRRVLSQVRQHLLGRVGAVEETPFGPQALVYKVGGRIFALVAHDESPLRISLKCDPERGAELRSAFPDTVRHAPYMDRRHWISVIVGGSLPDEEVMGLVDDSYDLVVARLPRKVRSGLAPTPRQTG